MKRWCSSALLLCAASLNASPPPPVPGERAAVYVDRYNSWLETIPQADRAWPELQRIDTIIHDSLGEFGGPTDDPNDGDRWEATIRFIEEHPEVMDAIRTNAAKPELGMLICDTDLPDNAFYITIPHLSIIRIQSKLLAANMILASEKQNSALILQNARGICNLSQHISVVTTGLEYAVLSANLKLLTAPLLSRTADPKLLNLDELQKLDSYIKSSSQANPRDSIDFDHFGAIDTILWCYEDSQDGTLTENGARRAITVLSAYKVESDMDPGPESAKKKQNDTDRIKWVRSAFSPLNDQLDFISTYFSLLKTELSVPRHRMKLSRCSKMMKNALNDPGTLKEYRLSLLSLPSIDRLLTVNTQSCISLNASRLLVAAHRHKLTYGSFPETLADFDPSILDFEPTDLFTGRPLHYKLVDGEPLIYSNGTDRDDDGGRPLLDDQGERIEPAPFYPLDPLAEIMRDNPGSIDGDWVLYPAAQ